MDHREQLPIGAELVGDYRIDGVLGQGGFGIHLQSLAPWAECSCSRQGVLFRQNLQPVTIP